MVEENGKIRSFEDLYIYQRAREFSRKIGHLARTLPESERYRLRDQMQRAKLSLTNNIAEGFGRFHYQENIQFCRQSRGSLCELIDDFNECFDDGYITETERDALKSEAYELIRILNSYIASIQRRKTAQ